MDALGAAGCGVVPTVRTAIALSVGESSVMTMIGPSFNAWLMDGVGAAERGTVQGLTTGYVLPFSVGWPFFIGAAGGRPLE